MASPPIASQPKLPSALASGRLSGGVAASILATTLIYYLKDDEFRAFAGTAFSPGLVICLWGFFATYLSKQATTMQVALSIAAVLILISCGALIIYFDRYTYRLYFWEMDLNCVGICTAFALSASLVFTWLIWRRCEARKRRLNALMLFASLGVLSWFPVYWPLSALNSTVYVSEIGGLENGSERV